MNSTQIALAALLPLAVACTDEPDEGQDALFQMSGEISGDTLPNGSSVGILWGHVEGEAPQFLGETAPVDALQGGTFDFSLFDLPPDDYVGDVEGLRFAAAAVIVFSDENEDGSFLVREDGSGLVSPDLVIGVALQDIILYVESFTPQGGSIWGEIFTNPEELTPGYHLIGIAEDCASAGSCSPAMTIQDNSLEISLTEASGDFPACEDELEICLSYSESESSGGEGPAQERPPQ